MNYELRLSKKQTEAFDLLMSDTIDELLYGGAKGGGKTWFVCLFTYLYAKYIVNLFGLKPMRYPFPVAFMGRKRGVDFNDTTLETWKKAIPSDIYTIRAQDKEIVIEDTVKICFGGLDDEETIKKFNSAEYGLVVVDQAEESTRDDIAMLRGTLRLTHNRRPLPHKLLLTANPAECWLKDDFMNRANPRRKYVQALPSDNEFIDSVKYIEQLKEAFRHRPELVEAYVFGSWDNITGFDYVFNRQTLIKAIDLRLPAPTRSKTIIACDVARFGDDLTVSYALRDRKQIDCMCLAGNSGDEVILKNLNMAKDNEASAIVFDTNGVGGTVFDITKKLKDESLTLFSFVSQEKCEDEKDVKRYFNKRAEATWKVSKMVFEGRVPIPNDMDLIDELCALKYDIRNGRILIEDKTKIKKRLGRSPDRADAWIMGQYIHDQAPYDDTIDYEDRQFNFIGRASGY